MSDYIKSNTVFAGCFAKIQQIVLRYTFRNKKRGFSREQLKERRG
jgi:hypothetical protein